MLARIQDKNILRVITSILILGAAYGVSIAVLAIHLERHDISKVAMGGLASAFALGIAAFAVPAGALIKRFGGKRVLLVALLGYAACVSVFPFLSTLPLLMVARFFDGAFSVAVWVASETALLERSRRDMKAFVMSLYANALAAGYVIGPIAAMGIVKLGGTSGTFIAAGVLAVLAALVTTSLDPKPPADEEHEEGEAPVHGGGSGPDSPPLAVLRRTMLPCLATFSYGYFQASVVIYLPLYLMRYKAIPEGRTIAITAFFAAGMLSFASTFGKLGDRRGHLAVMRALAVVGLLMIASFVLIPSFWLMCIAVFVAGATLASISPVSLALQGIVTKKRDLPRANAFYNTAYAIGMLVGPPISGFLYERRGGGVMLLHFAAMWSVFVIFTIVFRGDDPKAAQKIA